MRYFSATIAMLLVCGLAIGGATIVFGTQTATNAEAIYTPDELEWQDGPPSLPEGSEFVVLEGDPSTEGEYFALRLRLPDGYRIPPHWHPVSERVTVISGTFRLGHGDSFEAEATQPLEAGSYFSLPPQMRHFAQADGETIVQLSSIGPWDIRYVNPEDDPRRQGR